MKFYKRFPDRALAGMADLTPGQRGIYNSVIDLLYSRDGIVPCLTPQDDYRIAKNISVAPQTWRAYKRQLLAAGKIRITTDGRLDANGVQEGRNDVETHSETQRKRVSIRWQNYRLAKKFNEGVIPRRYYHRDRDRDSEIPEPKEHASPQNVDDVDNDESFGLTTTKDSKNIATGALEAVVRAKGWKA